MEKNNKKSVGLVGAVTLGVIFVVAIILAVICTVKVPVGYEAIQYSMNGGVKQETLKQGWHMVSPTVHTKKFTISNEQLILTKDKREGSKEDDSFYVATADNASIAVSFQMSYRFRPDTLVQTYSKFKGMDGQTIVDTRLKTVLKSKVSEITTDYSMMDVYSGNRSEINNKLTEYLDTEFTNEYGIQVIDASIIDVHPSKELKKAINARVKALQEKQQAEAEKEKIKVETETKQIQAEADAKIKVTEAQAEADAELAKATAEAEANNKLAESITDNLIRMKEAEARLKHGWVTIQGTDNVIVDSKNK